MAGLWLQLTRLRSGGGHEVRCDQSDVEAVPAALERLLGKVTPLDPVILNAGILGEVKPMHETSLAELERIMTVYVWSNKAVLDWLITAETRVEQIVAISSGAAVLGNMGGVALFP